MARVLVIVDSPPIAQPLVKRLQKSLVVETCRLINREGYAALLAKDAIDTVVYMPQFFPRYTLLPNLTDAELAFKACAQAGIARVVAISSAAIYGATPSNPGMLAESRPLPFIEQNPVGQPWVTFEALAAHHIDQVPNSRLTILRPAAMPVRDGTDFFSGFLRPGPRATVPLHDPSLQLLSPDDLAEAVCCAVERSARGIFNVAPSGVLPLRVAMRMVGARHVPVPVPVQQLWNRLLAKGRRSTDSSAYLRYSWTVSCQKISRELGFTPTKSSAEALQEMLAAPQHSMHPVTNSQHFDDFGLDVDYIKAHRHIFTFLHKYYWRTEVTGLGYVPRQGRAVLAGAHRGFMPFDGVMIVHLLGQEVGRYPRFLIHPCLLKTPFPFDFAKLGGVRVSRENADYMLQRDALLGFFPEGIEGAFRYYRGVYQLGKFGRDEFVKAALRNRAPIVPFVTVGSAEIFPVLAKFKWRWWKEQSLWPCFPIAPPFPLLPVPLPSKWHTQFLEPLHVEQQYAPEAANDAATVRAISQEVRSRMQAAIDDMYQRRKSIFFGSLFEPEAQPWVSGPTYDA